MEIRKFSSIDENLVKNRDIFVYTRKNAIFAQKFEYERNIESVKKYNLWFGNTIDCGFPRPLYTESVASYLGSKVVEGTYGTTTCGKKLYIASNCHASCATGGQ